MHAVCIFCGAICPAITVWGIVFIGCECVGDRWFGSSGKLLIVHIDHDPGDESD